MSLPESERGAGLRGRIVLTLWIGMEVQNSKYFAMLSGFPYKHKNAATRLKGGGKVSKEKSEVLE